MVELKRRLKELNVPSRKNVSVPNPADKDTGIVDQVSISCFEIIKRDFSIIF
jgi:hypothetical protein